MAANESTKHTHISNLTIGTSSGGGDLVVNGDSTFSGDLTMVGDLTLTGNVTLGTGSSLEVDDGTAAATGGAATLSKMAGKITSEALTTAAGADYTLTLTNTAIAAVDIVLVSVDNGTNTTAGLAVGRVTPGAGSVVILIRNTHASAALNGTIVISFLVVKTA